MNAHKARRREEIMDLILPHDVMYVDGWKNESIYMYLQIYIIWIICVIPNIIHDTILFEQPSRMKQFTS